MFTLTVREPAIWKMVDLEVCYLSHQAVAAELLNSLREVQWQQAPRPIPEVSCV